MSCASDITLPSPPAIGEAGARASAARPAVSVIIPAHNARETLPETLESLQAQTVTEWEAIVVDDGSRDGTAEIAAAFAARDGRIRVMSRPQGGVSAARNTGIAAAQFDWLLFLDADDWVLPLALQRLTDAILADPTVDGVHCGWAFVAPDGTVAESDFCRAAGDLFPAFATGCVFTIHACLIRRAMVETAGGFDPARRNCQDWDLWQRCARRGARWAAVPESLARYRMRPGSGSLNARQMLHDGLRVIECGYAADPRVADPLPRHAAGLPAEGMANTKLLYATWCAGLVIGSGEEAAPLLAQLDTVHCPALEPNDVAATLFKAIPRAALLPPSAWGELWPRVEAGASRFLAALETQSRAPGLRDRALLALARTLLARSEISPPATLGPGETVRLEVTQPMAPMARPETVERLFCRVEYAGERLGTLELPICDGLVPAFVLRDAVAAEHAWAILGRFFEDHVAGDLEIRSEADGVSVWRGSLCLGRGLRSGRSYRDLHDEIGWTLFLQELWDLRAGDGAPLLAVGQGRVRVEASAPLPNLTAAAGEVEIELAVGGAPVGVIRVAVPAGRLGAAQLREALEAACGFELCRAVVREAIVGVPPAVPDTLRGRLAAAAARRAAAPAVSEGLAGAALDGALPAGDGAMLLARRDPAVIGGSASRRVMLPAAAAPCLREAAAITSEPVWEANPGPGVTRRLIYLPELFIDAQASAGADPAAHVPSRPVPLQARLLAWARRQPRAGEETARSGGRLRANGSVRSCGAEPEVGGTPCVSLPILMYHRIAPAGPAGRSRFQVTPRDFEQQLCWLRDRGYAGVTLEEWRAAADRRRALPERAVLLTFDDGYQEFLTCAWPLLRRYDYPAIVFLVADRIGLTSDWNSTQTEMPLLGWKQIRQLRDAGVQFGSHTASHRPLTALDAAGITREAARSRAALQRGLGQPVTAIAYPYGDTDPVVEHLCGGCGYQFGLTCRPGHAYFHGSLLALPRIEVTGFDDLETFAARLDA